MIQRVDGAVILLDNNINSPNRENMCKKEYYALAAETYLKENSRDRMDYLLYLTKNNVFVDKKRPWALTTPYMDKINSITSKVEETVFQGKCMRKHCFCNV